VEPALSGCFGFKHLGVRSEGFISLFCGCGEVDASSGECKAGASRGVVKRVCFDVR